MGCQRARPRRGSGADASLSRSTSAGSSSRHLPGSSPPSVSPAYPLRCSCFTGWPTAASIRFTWCLRPSCTTSSTRPEPRRRARAGAVGPSSSSTPFTQLLQRLVVRLALDLGDVRLLDAVARVREPVRERPVVREQERPGRVHVEPSDGNDARLVGHELDDRRPSLRIARCRDDARRLVEQDVCSCCRVSGRLARPGSRKPGGSFLARRYSASRRASSSAASGPSSASFWPPRQGTARVPSARAAPR